MSAGGDVVLEDGLEVAQGVLRSKLFCSAEVAQVPQRRATRAEALDAHRGKAFHQAVGDCVDDTIMRRGVDWRGAGGMPDVAVGDSPQKSVAQRVNQHVRVRVPLQPLFVRNFYAAQHKPPPSNQPMRIITYSCAYHGAYYTRFPLPGQPNMPRSVISAKMLFHPSKIQYYSASTRRT